MIYDIENSRKLYCIWQPKKRTVEILVSLKNPNGQHRRLAQLLCKDGRHESRNSLIFYAFEERKKHNILTG